MSNQPTGIRTPLAKVRGLGSAHDGTHHWWMQRVTAVALVPLSLWLMSAIINDVFSTRDDLIVWLEHPFNALMLIALIGTSCYHGKLGIQVVVEDYIHCHKSKTVILIANALGFILLSSMAVMAIFKLHML